MITEHDEAAETIAKRLHEEEWTPTNGGVRWPCDIDGHLETPEECTEWHRALAECARSAIGFDELVASRERTIDIAVQFEGELHEMGWQV